VQITVDFKQLSASTIEKTERQLFINGKWRPADDGATFPVTNPATGETLTAVAEGGVSETRAAIDAAAGALPGWTATSAQTRADHFPEYNTGADSGCREGCQVGYPGDRF
jgi:delta 1-pyrroline-5-carboxylate dehydrogenase